MRRVFFSFHFQRDAWRVAQVRNLWVVRPDAAASPFLDAADWEKVARQGDDAIQRWINGQMDGTSVTVVLIGAETAYRPFVQYEIRRTVETNRGLLGVWIHNIRDRNGFVDQMGPNPLDFFNSGGIRLSAMYPTYDWVLDRGRENVGDWIEAAASRAGR